MTPEEQSSLPSNYPSQRLKKVFEDWRNLPEAEKQKIRDEAKVICDDAHKQAASYIAAMDEEIQAFIKPVIPPQSSLEAMAKMDEALAGKLQGNESHTESWWSELKMWWFLNRTIWFYRLRGFWRNQVASRFNPRNKWATKIVSRNWQDKPELIRIWLFAAIIDFVEKEKCFDNTVWEPDFAAKLHEVYDWAKTGREAAEKEMEKLWEPGDMNLQDGKLFPKERGDFDAYLAAEAAIDAKDSEYLIWIVSRRAYLWT